MLARPVDPLDLVAQVGLDHPDFTPWSDVPWEQSVTGSRSFRPDVSFVVNPDDSDQIV